MEYGTSMRLARGDVMYSVAIRAWTATENPDDSVDCDLTREEDMQILADCIKSFSK
jgi:hypothetical protein